jgi:DNA replication protein DnaC
MWMKCVAWLQAQRSFPRRLTWKSSRLSFRISMFYFSTLTWRVCAMTKATTRATAKAKTQQATRAPQSKTARSEQPDSTAQLTEQFRELRLPSFRDHFVETARRAARENLSHLDYLSELTTLECETRRQGRIKRLIDRSKLPLGKSWESFNFNRLPLHVTRQLETLRDGSFLDRRENVLLFGKPGSGKSHALCALSEQLMLQGRSMLFTTCSLLVQHLLVAKRELRLPKLIKQFSSFEGLIIDDLGYVQQSREEMEVLFTLLAERYERGSVLLTSNLAFSKWDQIFKDAMTTAAAIDRLVHHSVIIELNVPSYRVETAKTNKAKDASEAGSTQR